MSWEPGKTLSDIEKEAITKALRFHEYSRKLTAEALGITTRTLYTKIKEYKIETGKESNLFFFKSDGTVDIIETEFEEDE